jgi:hypothetical protein
LQELKASQRLVAGVPFESSADAQEAVLIAAEDFETAFKVWTASEEAKVLFD